MKIDFEEVKQFRIVDRLILCNRSNCEDIADYQEVNEQGREDLVCAAHTSTEWEESCSAPVSSAHRLAGAAHSLAVAMSALRRSHAGCRAPLRRATPPPISASSQPVRRLNPHLQPRISLVLRRAHWFCVSHSSECSMVVRSRLSDATPDDHSLCDSLRKPNRSDSNGTLANDQDRLIQIQIP
jgi:hypothetical protein